MRIVSHLSAPQQELFNLLNYYYNPVVYTVATLYWIRLVSRLSPYLRNRAAFFGRHDEVAALRRHALRLPLWGIAMTTLGWVPGSILFPLTLHLGAGPLPAAVFGHFLLSFTLSWLIAMSYSFLLQETIVLRVLYPAFWMGAREVRNTARTELAYVPRLMRLFCYLTGLIPLMGASLLVSLGPDLLYDSSYQRFQMLVVFLISLGIAGVFFALGTTQKLSSSLFALTGKNMKLL
jgi:hypothetical protein